MVTTVGIPRPSPWRTRAGEDGDEGWYCSGRQSSSSWVMVIRRLVLDPLGHASERDVLAEVRERLAHHVRVA
jgi:hypothetical protein